MLIALCGAAVLVVVGYCIRANQADAHVELLAEGDYRGDDSGAQIARSPGQEYLAWTQMKLSRESLPLDFPYVHVMRLESTPAETSFLASTPLSPADGSASYLFQGISAVDGEGLAVFKTSRAQPSPTELSVWDVGSESAELLAYSHIDMSGAGGKEGSDSGDSDSKGGPASSRGLANSHWFDHGDGRAILLYSDISGGVRLVSCDAKYQLHVDPLADLPIRELSASESGSATRLFSPAITGMHLDGHGGVLAATTLGLFRLESFAGRDSGAWRKISTDTILATCEPLGLNGDLFLLRCRGDRDKASLEVVRCDRSSGPPEAWASTLQPDAALAVTRSQNSSLLGYSTGYRLPDLALRVSQGGRIALGLRQLCSPHRRRCDRGPLFVHVGENEWARVLPARGNGVSANLQGGLEWVRMSAASGSEPETRQEQLLVGGGDHGSQLDSSEMNKLDPRPIWEQDFGVQPAVWLITPPPAH